MNEEMDVLIQKTILELLKHKEYKDIQMKEIAEKANIGRRTLYRYFAYKDEIMNRIVSGLMDDFADIVNMVNRMDLEGIAYAYFLFWEKHIEEMKLLKKAHLMYLLEDNLPDLVMIVSLKTKYKNLTREEWEQVMEQWSAEDKYNFSYMLAGYFKVAQLWMEEKNRKSPEEMARIMRRIVLREYEGE